MTIESWLASLNGEVALPPKTLRSMDLVVEWSNQVLTLVRQDIGLAKHRAQLALKLAQSLKDPAGLGRANRALGHVHLISGKPKVANQYYQRAWDHFAADKVERANTAVALVQSLAYVGDYDRAFSVAQEGRETYESVGDPFRAARIRANVGNILHRLDRLSEARMEYEEALAVLVAQGAEADVAIVMRNYGVCLMSMMRYAEADAMYSRARALFESTDQKLLTLEIDLNRAYLLGRQGRTLDALIEYRRLRDTYPIDLGFEIGNCLLDEADFMLEAGLWSDAIYAAQKAASIFESLDTQFELGKSKLLQAVAFQKKGEARAALAPLNEAKVLLRKEPNRNWHSLLHEAFSDHYELKGDLLTALKEIELSLMCPPTSERKPRVLRQFVDLNIKLGNVAAVDRVLEEADQPTLRARFANLIGHDEEAQNWARIALASYDAMRRQLGSEGLRRAVAAAEAENLRYCFRLLTAPEERFGIAVRLKDLALAESIHRPSIAPSVKPNDKGITDSEVDQTMIIREHLRLAESTIGDLKLPETGPNQRIVDFFTDDGLVFAYILEDGAIEEFVLGSEREFSEVADIFFLNCSRLSESGCRLANKALNQLAELVSRVFHGAPPAIGIGREGILMGLPFHALPQNDQPLIASHDITYVPSAAVWASLVSRSGESGSYDLVFGSADDKAPSIRNEEEGVAAMLGVKHEASFESMLARIADARRVHLAAHGFVRDDLPLMSAMQFGDKRLRVLDILRSELKAEFVALSGCSTGVSVHGEANDAQGLIEALLSSGARSVLASLWDAHDEVTTEWMYEFYGACRTSSVALAYKNTCLRMRDSHPHPGLWATFALFGVIP